MAYKKAIQLAPDNIAAHIHLAATYSIMGREKEARIEAAEVFRINPKYSLDYTAKILPYKDQSQTDKIINAPRKAGLKCGSEVHDPTYCGQGGRLRDFDNCYVT